MVESRYYGAYSCRVIRWMCERRKFSLKLSGESRKVCVGMCSCVNADQLGLRENRYLLFTTEQSKSNYMQFIHYNGIAGLHNGELSSLRHL